MSKAKYEVRKELNVDSAKDIFRLFLAFNNNTDKRIEEK